MILHVFRKISNVIKNSDVTASSHAAVMLRIHERGVTTSPSTSSTHHHCNILSDHFVRYYWYRKFYFSCYYIQGSLKKNIFPIVHDYLKLAELILQPFRHFTYVTTHSPTLPSLYLCHSLFPNPYVASPTSQFILQPFFRFSYVTSSSLNSPSDPPMIYNPCL